MVLREGGLLMKEMLRQVANLINFSHDEISEINEGTNLAFSDKILHLIVIGILGLLMLIVIYPVIKWLSKKGYVLAITGLYAASLVVFLTVAIEVGQKVTHRGAMELGDVVYGLIGFLIFFGVFAVAVKAVGHFKSRSSGPNGFGHRSDTL